MFAPLPGLGLCLRHAPCQLCSFFSPNPVGHAIPAKVLHRHVPSLVSNPTWSLVLQPHMTLSCRLRDPHQRGAPLPGGLQAAPALHRLPLAGGWASVWVGWTNEGGWGLNGSCMCKHASSIQALQLDSPTGAHTPFPSPNHRTWCGRRWTARRSSG